MTINVTLFENRAFGEVIKLSKMKFYGIRVGPKYKSWCPSKDKRERFERYRHTGSKPRATSRYWSFHKPRKARFVSIHHKIRQKGFFPRAFLRR